MERKSINLDTVDGVGWIGIDRPEKLNAVNADILTQLEAAVECCETDDRVRVLVVTGNDQAFIAGADLEIMSKAGVRQAFELTEHTMRVQERLAEFPRPTIAAIAGYALGAGLEIALCCDFRIAAENASSDCPRSVLASSREEEGRNASLAWSAPPRRPNSCCWASESTRRGHWGLVCSTRWSPSKGSTRKSKLLRLDS